MFSLSDRFLFWEMKKSHTLQRGENMQVAARAGLRVSPRNVVQFETIALVRWRHPDDRPLFWSLAAYCAAETQQK
jgi:hypothetical protein